MDTSEPRKNSDFFSVKQHPKFGNEMYKKIKNIKIYFQVF